MPANAVETSIARRDKMWSRKRPLVTAPCDEYFKTAWAQTRVRSSSCRHYRRILHRCRCDAQRQKPCEPFGACHHGAHTADCRRCQESDSEWPRATVQGPGEVQKNPRRMSATILLEDDVLYASFPFPVGLVTICLKKSYTFAQWKSTQEDGSNILYTDMLT